MNLTEDQRLLLEETNLPLLLLIEAEELNSDDENDASSEGDKENIKDKEDVHLSNEEEEITEPSPEDILAFEVEASEDKFLQFILYDKLTDMQSKITILKDNISGSEADELNINSKLEHYDQYLKVLNELIFIVNTNTIYKILGQINLELIDMLEIYNAALERRG